MNLCPAGLSQDRRAFVKGERPTLGNYGAAEAEFHRRRASSNALEYNDDRVHAGRVCGRMPTMRKAKSSISRRNAVGVLAGAVPAFQALIWSAQKGSVSSARIARGPFQASRESLATYRVPEWFRDAKFGIWAHWGPQSSVEDGDWYARNMYIQTQAQYKHHLEHYGHPSKFGYKDLISAWHGEKFDPEYLMGLYKKAGAKYFMSMGVHHDNFDMWNSKHNRWNAATMGIKKDVVGAFGRAARNHGLKFGVSDHLWISYKWFAVSHLADKDGPLAGVPYDGADPRFADLYHDITDPKVLTAKLDWNQEGIPESWKQHWALRIKDLVDNYSPDLLYCDGHLPFEDYGLEMLANFLNVNWGRNGQQVEGVYTSKHKEDSDAGLCVFDRERGVLDQIWPHPWQTDTCIGDWHYKRDITYKTPKTVVDMLVDIVSKNGNLMLNFPLPSSGMLDDRERSVLAGITAWMNVNAEGIHATRPWKISGQTAAVPTAAEDTNFNESKRKPLTGQDLRFTSKGQTLYAFVMDWPGKEAVIAPLATTSKQAPGKIENVQLLGYPGKLKWSRDEAALKISLPEQKPCDYAITFKVSGTGLV
jgi:alpha-L-fucosidase